MLWIWIGLDIQNIRKMFHEGASLSFSSKLTGHVYYLINVASTANLMKRLSGNKYAPMKHFQVIRVASIVAKKDRWQVT